jgi:hypothetical protein
LQLARVFKNDHALIKGAISASSALASVVLPEPVPPATMMLAHDQWIARFSSEALRIVDDAAGDVIVEADDLAGGLANGEAGRLHDGRQHAFEALAARRKLSRDDRPSRVTSAPVSVAISLMARSVSVGSMTDVGRLAATSDTFDPDPAIRIDDHLDRVRRSPRSAMLGPSAVASMARPRDGSNAEDALIRRPS